MAGGVKAGTVGELLIDRGVITGEQLDEALAAQSSLGLPLGETLIRLGYATPSQVFPVLQLQMNVPWADLSEGLVDSGVVPVIPREKAERYGVLALFRVRDSLTVAMHDPRAIFVIDEIEHITGLNVLPVLVSQTDVRRAIGRYYAESGMDTEFEAEEAEDSGGPMGGTEEFIATAEEEEEEGSSPVVSLVNVILSNAVREQVSDVHIEPGRQTISVRFRIDGELREVMSPKLAMHPALMSRLKVMTRMDIGEHRRPQDGRLMVTVDGRQIDVRASCMPTTRGEKMALRILDRERLTLDFDQLGMGASTRSRLEAVLTRPHGMILVTGPTGSGKTTTLYCLLDVLRGIERNIVSVEDPVEYELDLVNQVQVNEAIGLNFASALRTFLRQDPDYIMVGEIRDLETAKVAVQAALTGHLVLSTLHTNDSASTVARLINIGVDPSMASASVTAVMAQRLVRTICPKCAERESPPDEMVKSWGLDPSVEHQFMQGAGCSHCFGTGLRGRCAIYELLVFDDELRAVLSDGANAKDLRRAVLATGLSDLYTEGLGLVSSGRTTMSELLSVVGKPRDFGEEKS
jgi:type IV pilus assembly protein PilB